MRLLYRLALLALAASCSAIAGAAELPSRSSFHVGIALPADGWGLARHRAIIIAEADAIWRPSGISIADRSRDGEPVDVLLAVTFGALRAAGTIAPRRASRRAIWHRRNALGAISFDENSQPAHTITLDLEAVEATIIQALTQVCDTDGCRQVFMHLATSRALGRVLAHEIGHYLLAFPAHAPEGLMRSVFDGRELVGPDRRSFALGPELLPRLRGRLLHLRSDEARATIVR